MNRSLLSQNDRLSLSLSLYPSLPLSLYYLQSALDACATHATPRPLAHSLICVPSVPPVPP